MSGPMERQAMADSLHDDSVQSLGRESHDDQALNRDPPPSAAVYSSFVLRIYDILVLNFTNSYAWCCNTKKVLLPFFQEHLSNGPNHLDVGVGTGYYLTHSKSQLAKKDKIVLMDITPHTLAMAAQRIAEAGLNAETVFHDATKPWARPAHLARFDTISLFYVLHCIAGENIADKVHVFSKALKPHLEPDNGVLYGATVLGDEAGHNVVGRLLMRAYNRRGIFGNRGDRESDLRDALREHFEEVDVQREGRVALFTAKRPIFSRDGC